MYFQIYVKYMHVHKELRIMCMCLCVCVCVYVFVCEYVHKNFISLLNLIYTIIYKYDFFLNLNEE